MIDTEEEETQRTRSTSTHVHQNGNSQIKKDQRRRPVQVTQRRRKGRKEDPTWIQHAFGTFSMNFNSAILKISSFFQSTYFCSCGDTLHLVSSGLSSLLLKCVKE